MFRTRTESVSTIVLSFLLYHFRNNILQIPPHTHTVLFKEQVSGTYFVDNGGLLQDNGDGFIQ